MTALHDTTESAMPDPSLEASPGFIRAAALHFDEIASDRVTGHIDIGPDHHTPWGVVHGGVYATAVESATSVGASFAVKDAGRFAVGLANHTEFVRAHREGRLDLVATAVHQGRTGQLWDAVLTRGDGKVVARGSVRLQNVDLQ